MNGACIYILADWPARKETAAAIAARLDGFLGDLSRLDPTLARWSVGRVNPRMFPDDWPSSELLITANRKRDEFGQIEPNAGYGIVATSQDERQYFGFVGVAGAAYAWPMWNRLQFETVWGAELNPSIVTYALFRAIMLSVVNRWNPAFCVARSNRLKPDFKNEGWFAKAWMTYVPPDFAAGIDVGGIPLREATPDGGLLLSATSEVFDPDVDAHLAAAQRISRATQVLNATLPRLR